MDLHLGCMASCNLYTGQSFLGKSICLVWRTAIVNPSHLLPGNPVDDGIGCRAMHGAIPGCWQVHNPNSWSNKQRQLPSLHRPAVVPLLSLVRCPHPSIPVLHCLPQVLAMAAMACHILLWTHASTYKLTWKGHVRSLTCLSGPLQLLMGFVVWPGGLGSVGSLIAAWLTQQTSASLILLGRSGRPAKDSALTVASFGTACVTLARSDVAAAEEAAFTLTAARLHGQPLQASNSSTTFQTICLHCCSFVSLIACDLATNEIVSRD